MTRYTGPHPRRGEIDPPPGLVDLSKQMLGELANRIRLGAPPTLVIRRRRPEGFVEARMIYGKPQTFITVFDQPVAMGVVDGFFVRPTTVEQEVLAGSHYGTWWSENGDPHHIPMLAIKPPESQPSALGAYWFNAALKPEGAAVRYYEQWFPQPEGLQRTANLDWTGDKGVLHFFGPLNRYNDPATYFTPLIYHNGALLVDMQDVVDGFILPRVLGVALHGELELRVVLVRGFGTDLEIYRLPLQSGSIGYDDVPLHLHPRLAVTLDEDNNIVSELLGEFAFHELDAGFRHPLHFNQRGDECRAINWRWDEPTDGNVPYEVIFQFAANGSVAMAGGDLPFSTTTITDEVTTSGTLTNDIGIIDYDSLEAFPFHSNYGGIPDFQRTGGKDSVETSSREVDGWTKVFVDYRDNVPVYAEIKDVHGTSTRTNTREVTVHYGEGYAIFGPLAPYWSIWIGGPVSEIPYVPAPPARGSITTVSEFEAESEAKSEFRTDWILLRSEDNRSESGGSTGTVTVETPAESGHDTGQQTRVSTSTRTLEAYESTHFVTFVDLRTRLICYRKTELEQTLETTAEDESELVNDVFPNGGVTTTGTSRLITTDHVILNVGGVEVEKDEVAASDETTEISDYTARVYNMGVSGDESALTGLMIGFATAGSETRSEMVLVPPQLSFNYVIRHDDFNPTTPHAMHGSFAFSGNAIAYSYSIQPGIAEPPEEQTPQRYGICNLGGVPASRNWPVVTGANDPSIYRRYSPISAISPFVIK